MTNDMKDDIQTVTSELYRIHGYAAVLSELCKTGSSANISIENLEQVFADVAAVTDSATALLIGIEAQPDS